MASVLREKVNSEARPHERAGTSAADAEARIKALYAEHGSMLLAYATRATGDRRAAEEAVQETLLRAWRHADRLDAEPSVAGWLVTTVSSIVADRAGAGSSQPAGLLGGHADGATTSVMVMEALKSLSREHREVLIELCYRGRTAAQAGESLGIPAATVKIRSHYALRALRLAFKERQEVEI
jgi:RNA polymerase sigma-70 factor (ECF subfamily)